MKTKSPPNPLELNVQTDKESVKMYEESRMNNTQAADVPQRAPQVVESLETLERTVEAHLKLCAEMEQRLSPILRSEPEMAEAGQKETTRTVVGLASRINEIHARLHQIGNSYNSILRRLEL